MTKKIEWMKNSSMTDLHTKVKENLDRYRSGSFDDLVDSGWRQKAMLEYEDDAFDALSGDSSDDLADTLIVFEALKNLSPNHAVCMNIWVPLIHTDLLSYARKRWFSSAKTDEDLVKSINTHIFKSGTGGFRDDNVIGRLWWTGYVGSRMAGSKDIADIKQVLEPFMRTTDTRMSVIERPGIFSETGLARNISSYIADKKLPEHDKDKVFREFMVNINLRSNGRHFGDMNKAEVYAFLDGCR